MPRFPSPGSLRVKFPGFFGTTKALRLPAGHSAAFRFLHLAVPRDHAYFAPRVAACGNGGPGVGHSASPSGHSSVETTGSPKFLGNPNSRLHMFSDPGRPKRSRPIAERSRGPRSGNDEDANNVTLSGLNSMAFGLAAYVSRIGFPPTRKTGFQVLVRLSRAGLYPQGSVKRFQLTPCALASLSKLLGTIPAKCL